MTFDELCEEYARTDTFMEPQVKLDEWFVYESADGLCCIPYIFHWDVERDDILDAPGKYFVGYGARLSAPGYMDCTDWTVFDTEQGAIDYLAETYLED